MTQKAPKRDIHAEVTDRIIASVESNPGAPQMPWRRHNGVTGIPVNALTKAPYNGVNIVNLWVAAKLRGFTAPIFATYKQWQELGAQVRRGEASELIVFYKSYEVAPDPDREDDDGQRRVARPSYVFNIAQVDGAETPPPPKPLPPLERIAAVDRFVSNTKIPVIHEGDRACYVPASDTVIMPPEGLFCGTDSLSREEGYYAVLCHELTHATGHRTRCNRDLSGTFGSESYAREELVAEIASAMLCAELAITQDTRPDHAAYIATWLKILKADPKAIFKAAARASEAVTFLKRLQDPSTRENAA